MRILIFLLAGPLCFFVFNSYVLAEKKFQACGLVLRFAKANGLGRQADHDAVFVNVCKGLVSFFILSCLAHFQAPMPLPVCFF
jgi:hypothetical protein